MHVQAAQKLPANALKKMEELLEFIEGKLDAVAELIESAQAGGSVPAAETALQDVTKRILQVPCPHQYKITCDPDVRRAACCRCLRPAPLAKHFTLP